MLKILFHYILVLAVFTMLGCANQTGTKQTSAGKAAYDKMRKSTNPDNNI